MVGVDLDEDTGGYNPWYVVLLLLIFIVFEAKILEIEPFARNDMSEPNEEYLRLFCMTPHSLLQP